MSMDYGKNYASQPKVKLAAEKLYSRIVDGYKDQHMRNDQITSNWNVYNCTLDENQKYQGISQIYVPAVRDCIEARVKRVQTSVFPPNGRNIFCVSYSGDKPEATVALLEQHLRLAKFQETASALLRSGDVEGQWSIYVDWAKHERTITKKSKEYPKIEGEEIRVEELGVDSTDEEIIIDEHPDIWVIADSDLCVLPSTVDDLRDAEIVSIVFRLSKEDIKRRIKDGFFLKAEANHLLAGFEQDKQQPDPQKDRAMEAGIKSSKSQRHGMIFEVWTKLKISGEETPVVIHYGGRNSILAVYRNPYWCQLPPVLSAPPTKIAGSFFGAAKVTTVTGLQYQLNDMTNLGQDSAFYTLNPIVMTDPSRNPRVASMIVAPAAIWETSPNDTKFAEFPPLYQHSLTLSGVLINQIKESMDINDSILNRGAGRKNTKQIAAESVEASMSISHIARTFETSIMDPLVERIYEYDQQFRKHDLVVTEMGELGEEARVEVIEPHQAYKRYYFKWVGTETASSIQRTQQQIATMNILRSIPPNAVRGKTIDIGPIIEGIVEQAFNPTTSRKVLYDNTKHTMLDPELENQMLYNNLPVHVHPEDKDDEHLKAHVQAAHLNGDPNNLFRQHITEHMAKIQQKIGVQPGQQGIPGVPGGAAAGTAGTPKMGAQPDTMRGGQNPPGSISPDSMQDPTAQRMQ